MIRPLSLAYAQTNDVATINTTVKLNICGDDVVEGPEDCEGSNLNGKSCTSLGYGGGDLTCDIACTFDTSACTAPTPTPTPSPTPTLTVTPTSAASPSDESSSPTIATQPSTSLTTTQVPTSISVPILPPALQIFDINGIGKILTGDLPVVVKLWVDEWRRTIREEVSGGSRNSEHKKCDVNEDSKCDIKDFSVLMFYVER